MIRWLIVAACLGFVAASVLPAPVPVGPSYVLPMATSANLGGIKQGAGLTIAPDGTLTSKVFSGSCATAADGTCTAAIAPACSSAPSVVELTGKVAASGLTNMINAALVSATASSVTVQAARPATLAALGLTIIAPPTGTAVMVLGVCP